MQSSATRGGTAGCPLVVVGAVSAVVEAGLGLGVQIPVVGPLKQRREGDGEVDLLGGVRAAGLDQRDADLGILRESAGDDSAGRSGADDDIVVHGGLLHRGGSQIRSRTSVTARSAARTAPSRWSKPGAASAAG